MFTEVNIYNWQVEQDLYLSETNKEPFNIMVETKA